jgi:hypothetical protein
MVWGIGAGGERQQPEHVLGAAQMTTSPVEAGGYKLPAGVTVWIPFYAVMGGACHCLAAGLLGRRAAGLLGCCAAGLPGCRAAGLQALSGWAAAWPRVAQLQPGKHRPACIAAALQPPP